MREAASFLASQTILAPEGTGAALVRHLRNAIRHWKGRRDLVKLTELDDHMLADIGLARDDVSWALDLPFPYDPALALQQRAGARDARGWRGA